LGGGVDDAGGAESFNEVEDAGAIADIDGMMGVVLEGMFEAFLVPGGIAIGAEELAALVVVDSVDRESSFVKGLTHFRADEASGPGNQDGLLRHCASENVRVTHLILGDKGKNIKGLGEICR
jgi:hypothetical protein